MLRVLLPCRLEVEAVALEGVDQHLGVRHRNRRRIRIRIRIRRVVGDNVRAVNVRAVVVEVVAEVVVEEEGNSLSLLPLHLNLLIRMYLYIYCFASKSIPFCCFKWPGGVVI